MSVEHGIYKQAVLSFLADNSELHTASFLETAYRELMSLSEEKRLDLASARYFRGVLSILEALRGTDEYEALNVACEDKLKGYEDSGVETEFKYLIAYPDVQALKAVPGSSVIEIEQIYLTSSKGETRRIRRWLENGQYLYFRTSKVKIDRYSAKETESLISKEAYEQLLEEADPMRSPIHKTRYRISCGEETAEIDVYDFWQDRAICEVEVESPDEKIELPSMLTCIRDVTGEREYKNASLAGNHDLPL